MERAMAGITHPVTFLASGVSKQSNVKEASWCMHRALCGALSVQTGEHHGADQHFAAKVLRCNHTFQINVSHFCQRTLPLSLKKYIKL
jgi:hypothetical protein